MTDIVLSIRELDDYEEIYVVSEKEKIVEEKKIEKQNEVEKPKFGNLSSISEGDEPPIQTISDSDIESLESASESEESEFEMLMREMEIGQDYSHVGLSGPNYCKLISDCCSSIRTYTCKDYTNYVSSIYNDSVIPYIRGIKEEIRKIEQNVN